MSAHDPTHTANPGYAFGQLERALRAASEHRDPAVRARAAEKIRRWEQVVAGMREGTLSAGSRTPVRDVPAWVTLEVAHGGFATGSLLAGGALQAHEEATLARVGGRDRASINGHFVSDAGLRELAEMLRTGCYRVQVPEEGVLLVVSWLFDRGEATRALDLLDTIEPFLDRLRFYPVPNATPMVPSSVVRLQTVSKTVTDLEAVRTRPQVERMNEALRFWNPLYDRAVALFIETVRGDVPAMRTNADGSLVRRPDGQGYVDGAWPCQHYPEGWPARALALLAEYERLRASHTLCHKPEDPEENFARLRANLAKCARDPRSLTGRDVGYVRKIIAAYVTKHGAPESEKLRRVREAQARIAAMPSHKEYSRVVIERLRAYPAEGGIGSLDDVAAALTTDEAARLHTSPGAIVPESLIAKTQRCLEAPAEELVKRGVIPSGEVLAIVLPQVTAQVRAAGFADPKLRLLHGALYAAFRRRRSLLLLNLEHQVTFDELPWVAALKPFRSDALDEKLRARETLRQVSALVVSSFPETIVPNKLLQEMRSLVEGAGLSLPLVDELAADIFMGTFSEKFVRAAQTAAKMLQGSLYARYYGVPCERVLAIDDFAKRWGVSTSPGFAALCVELAGAVEVDRKRGFSVARNGTIIEQEQILTTHNLAALFDALDLREVLRGRLPEMARECFTWVCKRMQVKVDKWHARLVSVKNCAYAWRQMLFYLSVAEESERDAFVPWAEAHLAEQDDVFRMCFAPAVAGLRLVADGGSFDAQGRGGRYGSARRFLGWSDGKHWLLA